MLWRVVMERRTTRQVSVGDICIGGGSHIAIQTMWDAPLPSNANDEEYQAVLTTLRKYRTMGCDIIRFSYPSKQDHTVFSRVCQDSPMPVVADIHFDWKLAMDALDCGAHKIRINPGNIGARWKVDEVVRSAKDHGAAIRIGLNGGSLPMELRMRAHAQGMVDTALTYIEWFEALDFHDIILSVKDSDTQTTYEAYRNLSGLTDYPLHLGVTEAGGVVSSVTRSTWALGRLLSEGIGDTIRISITDDREFEILAARELLRTIGLDTNGIRIVSCPRCGRASFDSQGFLKKVQGRLMESTMPLTVAIMGCQVNGPGESSHADLAVTGIGNRVFIYEHGKLLKEVPVNEAEIALFDRLEVLSHAE